MLFGDGSAYSNITDPVIPARFQGVISTVRGLDNFLHSTTLSHYLPVTSQAWSASGWPENPLVLLDSGLMRPPSSLERQGPSRR